MKLTATRNAEIREGDLLYNPHAADALVTGVAFELGRTTMVLYTPSGPSRVDREGQTTVVTY